MGDEAKRPVLMSVVGTYMKPEMHTIYRQIANIRGFDHVVVTERLINRDRFPFDHIEVLERVKLPKGPKEPKPPSPDLRPTRPCELRSFKEFSSKRGNCISRFWWKHVKKEWPPPYVIKPLLPGWMMWRTRLKFAKRLRRHAKKVAKFRRRQLEYRARREAYEQAMQVRLREVAEHEARGFAENASPCRDNNYLSSYDLKSMIERLKPDVVHLYFGNKAVGYVTQMNMVDVPWIVSFHGADIAMNLDCDVYAERFGAMFASASLVAARSGRLMEQLEEHGCPSGKIRLNRTAIPMEEIPFSERDVPGDGEWRVIQCCRLLEKKGLATAIRGFAIARGQFPNARFIICGDGPMEEELRSLVAELGLGDSVEFTGRLEHDELFAQFAASHIFLHPSETPESGDQEGVPNALLEAMASGLPYVSTLHGGIPEVLGDASEGGGEGGHLVPEKSPELVGEALMKLMGDEAHYHSCAASVRGVVDRQFSLERSIGQLESIYREAIELGRRAPAG